MTGARFHTVFGDVYILMHDDIVRELKLGCHICDSFIDIKLHDNQCDCDDIPSEEYYQNNDIIEKIIRIINGSDEQVDTEFYRGTIFQQKVWNAIKEIPYGSTITYKQLAEKIGHPKSFRAVANACGANPIPIIVPCHRVVASNGIGGYVYGGEMKQMLLEREREKNL